jgi:hypothetical protein
MSADEESDQRGEGDDAEDGEGGRLAGLRAAADAEADSLQRGPSVSLLGASVPVRALTALGIFVLVFMLVWVALWGLLGTLGLALGWIPAAGVGVLAIRLVGPASAAD